MFRVVVILIYGEESHSQWALEVNWTTIHMASEFYSFKTHEHKFPFYCMQNLHRLYATTGEILIHNLV